MASTEIRNVKAHTKRVLQVNLEDSGGAFALMFQVQKQMQGEIFFDYYTMSTFRNQKTVSEIEKMGGRIYCGNLRRNRLIGHILLPFVFYGFLKKEVYNTIHIHSDTAWKICLYAIPARLAGVNKIIIHSHSAGINGDYRWLKTIMHKLMRPIVSRVGTDYCTCSELASAWMFGDRVAPIWIKNGVDTEQFRFSETARKEVRARLGLNAQTILIGTVGDFSFQKKPEHLLWILRKLANTDKTYRLVYVGSGDNEETVRREAKECGLSDKVIFYGRTDRVQDVLCAMDIYVMPSRFEGLPVSAIEAQANGLPCILSSEITEEVGLGQCCVFLGLSDDISVWADAVEEFASVTICREAGEALVRSQGFDIRQTAEQVRKMYGKDNR